MRDATTTARRRRVRNGPDQRDGTNPRGLEIAKAVVQQHIVLEGLTGHGQQYLFVTNTRGAFATQDVLSTRNIVPPEVRDLFSTSLSPND